MWMIQLACKLSLGLQAVFLTPVAPVLAWVTALVFSKHLLPQQKAKQVTFVPKPACIARSVPTTMKLSDV